MGLGWDLLINLEEAKTPIQHVKTFKALLTFFLKTEQSENAPEPTNSRSPEI